MMTPPATLDLAKEIEALERVLFRLASVSDERLIVVLDTLLPQLLALFPTTLGDALHVQFKDKILQVISHIKTRLHAIAAPRLPLAALGAILREPGKSVFTYNFTVMFIEMGFSAATRDEQAVVLAQMRESLTNCTDGHRETFFRLLLRSLPVVNPSEVLGPVDEGSANIVLDILLDVVLFQPTTSSAGSSEILPSAAAFGLSIPRVERLQRIKVTEMKREDLYDCQLRALQFVKQIGEPALSYSCLHYVAGVASYHHVIKAFCEEQLGRIVKEQHEVDPLEDSRLCRDLICLILSSQVAQSSGAFQEREVVLLSNRARLADASILQALSLLNASKVATKILPLLLQLLCQLMFGAEPSRPQNIAHRIKVAGIKLCQWTFHHSELQHLNALLGPVLLPSLLRVLMDPNADLDSSEAPFWREFRQGIYECLSVLSLRAPTLMTATEQPFQVLLVRSIVEEANRTGANALKAMGALREAYASSAPPMVVSKVQSELIGLLKGEKLYDPTKNYDRVRSMVGEWAWTVIGASGGGVGASGTDLRFALLKLSTDKDEGVRKASHKALYAQPLPSVCDLVTTLHALFPARDLKATLKASIAEQCLLFCEHVLSERLSNMEEGDERSELIEYFVETFLKPVSSTSLDSPHELQALYASVATRLIRMHSAAPAAIRDRLRGRGNEILKAMLRSCDRSFLQNASKLLELELEATATAGSTRDLSVLEASLDIIQSSSASINATCGATYAICTSAGFIGRRYASSEEAKSSALRALTVVTTIFESLTVQASDFATVPRGEEAQNDLLDRLRSCIDGLGIAGNWNEFIATSATTDNQGATWDALRSLSVDTIRTILQWKLEAISSDGHLKQKLNTLRRVALEGLSQIIRNSQWSLDRDGWLDSLCTEAMKLGSQGDTELQFAVADTLLSFGSSRTAEGNHLAPAIVARILKESSNSRRASERRSATIWLLCICAVALASSHKLSSVWHTMFQSPDAANAIVEIHEFFVTMLNDADAVTTECAVKGLAYLRLKAPTAELGDKFSDSLFRRLRCFRAFASSSGSTPIVRGEDDDEPLNTTPATSASPAQHSSGNRGTGDAASSSSTASGDTVENIAYREVSNVAADVGDPELMYTLLYLSTTDPVWDALNTRAKLNGFVPPTSFQAIDASFRQSIIAQVSKEWMSESFVHRQKLVPWLYLLKSHSNKNVSEVMNNLWNFAKGELVTSSSEEKSLLSQQWGVIFEFLLTKLEFSRNFKYREAACTALVDLLNGANPDDVRAQFVRLWKLTSRSVDDIMEAVAVAGLKLFKFLGELSLRVATKDDECRHQLLDYLIAHGIVSKNLVCRALSIDLLLRLVKELDASAVQERLSQLMLKLLEYLSSLEMPELQYAQFHVDKKDQLERLRVSLSQSGPVGQLLEQCTIKLRSVATDDNTACVAIVDEICRGVVSLLKFGVGLNTRVGTANFVVALATDLPFEVRKCGGAELILSRALIPYVGDRSASENDSYGDEDARYGSDGSGLSDVLMLQAYCRAAAFLCPLVDTIMVKSFVRDGIFACHKRRSASKSPNDLDAADTYISRFLLVSALSTKELVAKCPPITDATALLNPDDRNAWYCSDVFPAAFIGQFASSETLKTTWIGVLEELSPTIKYAPTSLLATLRIIGLFIRHPSWDTRRQGVKALESLFSSASAYRSRISVGQTDQIWTELLASVPGRLWRGKGVILEALVAIATVRDDSWCVLSDLLVDECDRAWKNHDMEYLESALVSLGTLSRAMPPTEVGLRFSSVAGLRSRLQVWRAEDNPEHGLPPMMIKVVFESIAAVWPAELATSGNEVAVQAKSMTIDLVTWLVECVALPELHVWSVRRAVLATIAAVVSSAPTSALANDQLLSRVVRCCAGDVGVGDAKYSTIRVAAGEALAALVSRHAGDPALALQLVARREQVTAAMDVLRRSDEPKERVVAAAIFTHLTELQR